MTKGKNATRQYLLKERVEARKFELKIDTQIVDFKNYDKRFFLKYHFDILYLNM